jgi:FtsH-binding integral membrane protein
MATALFANIVWPALFLADRLTAGWCVGVGLALEFAILHRAVGLPWRSAAAIAGVMNGVSAFIGWMILPWWGWHWESAVQSRNVQLGYGTFNPLTWRETFILACVLNTLIEWSCFQAAALIARRPIRGSVVGWLLLANVLTVGLAYWSLSLRPVFRPATPWGFPWFGVLGIGLLGLVHYFRVDDSREASTAKKP